MAVSTRWWTTTRSITSWRSCARRCCVGSGRLQQISRCAELPSLSSPHWRYSLAAAPNEKLSSTYDRKRHSTRQGEPSLLRRRLQGAIAEVADYGRLRGAEREVGC